MSTEAVLGDIFRMVFDDDSIEIRRDMTANDIDGWDSLSHVNLITTVEAKFNIRFSQKDLLTQRNIGDLIDDIERKLAATC